MTPLFALRDVDVRLGQVIALKGLSLQINHGEAVALIGANGSGKSSLLRLLHGLVPPAAGVCETAPNARQAMVFQRPHMFRAQVVHCVALGLWLAGRSWREAMAGALAALQRVGLADLAKRPAKTLSGGQQQRLALARAWAVQPDVLLLDEPTASLDPRAKHEVERLIGEFAASAHSQAAGKPPLTLVFASHNLGQVKRLASRVIYLERGRVLADLPVKAFFDRERLRQVSAEADLFLQGEFG
jgi:tungstate transport system ATP-binding protein